MSQITVFPTQGLNGEITVDGDKSITHRAIMHASIGSGVSRIHHYLSGNDCQATIECMRLSGVSVEQHNHDLVIHGKGVHGLSAPAQPLDCVRSGTTMRLLMGLLSGTQHDSIILDGDTQLLTRPMERVAEPLRLLGANITTTNGKAPVEIRRGALVGKEISLRVPSAQVTSALIYAGLYAESETVITQTAPTRDHTERMLRSQGADIQHKGHAIKVLPVEKLSAIDMVIPGDISSAAFPIVAAVLSKNSSIEIKAVGLNDSRMGLISILQEMGARITIVPENEQAIEPIGTIIAESSQLSAVNLGGDVIVRAIDEIPIVALLATQAQGTTIIQDASELRVKETDRISSICSELNKMGANIEATPDGMIIHGPTALQGASIDSHGDHRIAMALFVAALIAHGESCINDFDCVTDSFPGFISVMKQIGAKYA